MCGNYRTVSKQGSLLIDCRPKASTCTKEYSSGRMSRWPPAPHCSLVLQAVDAEIGVMGVSGSGLTFWGRHTRNAELAVPTWLAVLQPPVELRVVRH